MNFLLFEKATNCGVFNSQQQYIRPSIHLNHHQSASSTTPLLATFPSKHPSHQKSGNFLPAQISSPSLNNTCFPISQLQLYVFLKVRAAGAGWGWSWGACGGAWNRRKGRFLSWEWGKEEYNLMSGQSLARLLVVLVCVLGVAVGCPANCNDCDPQASVCFACGEGFHLSVMGTCVDARTIPNCILYGPTNQCFSCEPTYTIFNGQCVKDYSACLETDPSDDTACLTCGFGTVLAGKKCAGTINCGSAANPCPACLAGFTLGMGICTDNTGNCLERGKNGVCLSCKEGFKLVGYSCLARTVAVYGCFIYDAAGTCQLCKSGYNMYQGNCLLPSQIQQILQGAAKLTTVLAQRSTLSITTTSTTTTTTTSESGFGNGFTNDFGGFGGFGETGFGSGDGSFGLDSTPNVGGQGNFGISTPSAPSTPTPPPAIANCEVADPVNLGKCISCNSGWYPGPTGCLQVSVFCAANNIQTGDCLSCKYGLLLSNGKCSDPNCVTQTLTGCTACSPSFVINGNSYCQYSDANCVAPGPTRCNQCAATFFVTANGLCRKLPNNCQAANVQTFACINCTTGFRVNAQGLCDPVPVSFPPINNCVNQNGNQCLACRVGFQISSNQCLPVPLPANCQAADPNNPTVCVTCLNGFTLRQGGCVQTQNPTTPFCQSYNLLTGVCVACIPNYTLANAICTPTPPPTPAPSGGQTTITNNNNNFNSNSNNNFNSNSNNNFNSNSNNNFGASTTSTTISTISTPGSAPATRDPNCAKYNGSICSACSNRYYSSSQGTCTPVNPLCKDYSFNGGCLSCYPGYTLLGTSCIVAKQNDPYCRSFTPGGICTACYTGYFYNQAKAGCQPNNPLCKTSNQADGSCTSCFPGYNLANGLCGVAFQDPNCQKFDTTKNACTQCSIKFYLDLSGRCRQVSPLCKTADSNTGACLSCYPGYVLSGAACSVGGANTMDFNCQTLENSVCKKCYNGYFLNFKGTCVQSNPLCKTSDSTTGACLSCYPGYAINMGNCSLGFSSTRSADTNCKATDDSGVCSSCYGGYFLTAGRSCQRLDPLCKGYANGGSACGDCYDGYALYNGQCVIATELPTQNNDPYCIKANGKLCATCAQGYYLAQTGNCSLLDPLCKTSDPTTGACTDCYAGYTLSGTTCIVAAVVNIPYCTTVVGNSCVACLSGYYVSEGACQLVNLLCGTYDQTNGACLSCIPGYVFQGGQCIYPSLGEDKNCAQYTNSYCTTCVAGYALINFWCSVIDPNCLQFDAASNTCKQCGNALTPSGASCF